MSEEYLRTALETRCYSIDSLERVNKHYALGKIIISWIKKKIAFLENTVYFYSKLLFVNTVFCTLGVAVPSVHVSFRQRN